MKRFALLTLLVAMAVAACSTTEVPSSPVDAESTSESPAATIAVTVTNKDVETEAEPGEATDAAPSEPEAPISSTDRPNVVRARDHVLGATTPVVTIIEYGDFQ